MRLFGRLAQRTGLAGFSDREVGDRADSSTREKAAVATSFAETIREHLDLKAGRARRREAASSEQPARASTETWRLEEARWVSPGEAVRSRPQGRAAAPTTLEVTAAAAPRTAEPEQRR